MATFRKIIEKNKKKLATLVFLSIIAFIPRGIEVLSGNYLFTYDMGVYFNDIKEIVADKNLTLIGTEVGGRGGFFQGPGWYYLLAIPFALTFGDPYGAMVLMLIIGIFTVVISFILFERLFGFKIAFLIAFFIAISPEIITHSRFIWAPFPLPFLTVFLLFFLYKFLKKEKNFFPLFTFPMGMMTHFETAPAATLLVSFIILSPLIFIKKIVSKKYIFFGFIAILLTQLPLILFDLRNNFLNIKGILRLLFSPTNSSEPFTSAFHNKAFIFTDNFFNSFQDGKVLAPFIILFILIGAFALLRDKKEALSKKYFIAYLLLSPILLFLIFLRYKGPIWGWWIFELNVYYVMLASIILVYIYNKINFLKILVVGFLLYSSYIFSIRTLDFYKKDFNDFGGVHKIRGKTEVIDYIYKDANGKPFNLLIFEPPVYTPDYDYLLWWYGQEKYGYIPGKEQKGLFYLLIQPDPAKLWSYKGWLGTVVNKGKTLSQKKFESGFIVIKRIEEE